MDKLLWPILDRMTMPPHKHVAPTENDLGGERFQEVMGTSLVRFAAPWGTIPVVATAELDRISLAYWDSAAEHWRYIERPHAPLRCDGLAPGAPNTWNWSDTVALATSHDSVYAVYKRERRMDDEAQTAIFIDRFVADTATPQSRQLVLAGSDELGVERDGRRFGRHLWARWDGDALLLLYQEQVADGAEGPPPVTLQLTRVRWVAGGIDTSDVVQLDTGGHDLDARLDERVLVIVHRPDPAAVRLPLLLSQGDGFTLGSGPAFDPHYPRLQLLRHHLDQRTTAAQTIPGGEHPRLESLHPLLVTFERHRSTLVQLLTPLVVLPPERPRYRWQEQGIDKVAWLRVGAPDARGVLLQEVTTHLAPSLSPLSQHARLLELDGGEIVARAPFDTWPTPLLQLQQLDERTFVLDVLHHRTHLALFRTRFALSRLHGELVVNDTSFEVWDIGHAHLGDPTALVPDATAENDQFAPFGPLALSASTVSSVAGRECDTTMGGFLSLDRDFTPALFFAYSDMGDGGLRVIFGADTPPLEAPPPRGTDRSIRPDQVSGPHLPCEVWVQLDAPDWRDANLPGYEVGALNGVSRSLGAATERALDTLLQSLVLALGPEAPSPADGVTDAQFDAVDTFRSNLVPPVLRQVMADNDVPMQLTIDPGPVLRVLPFTVGALVAGAAPPAVWTLVRRATLETLDPVPAGAISPALTPPVSMQVAGANPATFSATAQGRHRLSVFVDDGTGAQQSAFVNIRVGPLVRDMVWALHDGVARADQYRIGDLDFSVLQYDLGFRATPAGVHEEIRFGFPSSRRTEWRFRGGGLGQGIIDYRALVSMQTTDMELLGLLDSVFRVESFSLDFTYARPFTPGVLMRDSRALEPLRGDDIANAPQHTVQRRESPAHAAIGAKPAGNTSTPSHDPRVELSTRVPLATITVILAVITLLGAVALAVAVTALLLSISIASVTGVVGLAIAAAATAALLFLLLYVLPRAAEAYANSLVSERFTDGTIREQLDDQALLRYAGEGLSEALARAVLAKARDDGHEVPEPAGNDAAGTGRDRFRGQLFQMVFVTEGACRVLVRLPECVEPPAPDITVPGMGPGGGVDPGMGSSVEYKQFKAPF